MEKTIFKTIIETMNIVENIINLNGKQKKEYVLNEMKILLSDESYERYYIFIGLVIDGIVDISKKDIKLLLNKKCLKLL